MELLKMTNITKSFSGVEVLSHVDFSVERGEVHALLGENGAGKSTLMNILAGVHQRDEGEIEFDGEQMHDISVKRTEQAGIAFVHQELNLFNDLKVYENIFLRKELLTKLGTLDKRAMLEQTRQLMSDLGVDIDPNALVDELETSKKQLLEIGKGASRQWRSSLFWTTDHRAEQRGDRAPVQYRAAIEGAGQVLHLHLPQNERDIYHRGPLHGPAEWMLYSVRQYCRHHAGGCHPPDGGQQLLRGLGVPAPPAG